MVFLGFVLKSHGFEDTNTKNPSDDPLTQRQTQRRDANGDLHGLCVQLFEGHLHHLPVAVIGLVLLGKF